MKTVMNSRTLRALSTRARIAGVVVVVAFAGLFMAACGGSTEPRTAATLTISPTPVPPVAAGGMVQFTVVVKDAKGNVLSVTPTWSVTAGGGTITSTGLFTAGTTPGTVTVSVTCSGITATVTFTVTAGPLLKITVKPDTTLVIGATAQFRAVGTDAFNNVVAITPVWSTVNPPGSINASTGLFTAGNTTGTFPASVRATQGAIFGTATVTVIAPPAPPPPALGFTILADVSVTCTNGSIIGNVGINQVPPTGVFIPTTCPVTGGTVQIGTPAAKTAYTNFLTAYTNTAAIPCGTILTGTLAGQNLPPGVYCFTAGAALTGVLTLTGPANGVWLFKIGTTGGALTTNLFTVVMAGGNPCNVQWWTQAGATMTDSDFKGTVLAGTDATTTRGTLNGNFWARGNVTITGTAVTGCP